MIEYLLNQASESQIAEHLSCCDAYFVPPLSERVMIEDYSHKIISRTIRFEAWSSGRLVGLVAAYCNDQVTRIAYVTSVSVLREWMGEGISARLLSQCVEHAKAAGMRQISLEVANNNASAIRLYEKLGFVAREGNASFMSLDLHFESRK